MLRRALQILAVLAVLFGFFATGIIVDGLTDDLGPTDVGVVLGSKVDPDGQPSPRLAARLTRALELYERGEFKTLIVSGGTGVEGFDEAKVMKAWLVARKVPAEAILVDSQGVNTWATAVNSAALMRRHGFTSATVITQYFHIPRARMALRRQGFTDVRTAHARFFEWRDAYSTAREVIGFAPYLFRSPPA